VTDESEPSLGFIQGLRGWECVEIPLSLNLSSERVKENPLINKTIWYQPLLKPS